jgi:hypothetical protein
LPDGPALFEGCTIVYGGVRLQLAYALRPSFNRFGFGSDSCESKQDVNDFWLILYSAGAVLILGRPDGIYFSEHHLGDGEIMFRHACEFGLEGHPVEASRCALPPRAARRPG